MSEYDVIIIGSGPAGLTAAIYSGRALVKTLVVGGRTSGGQLMLTSGVENFPGFADAVQGPNLMAEMRKQAERFGAEFIDDDIDSVDFSSLPFKIVVGGDSHTGKAVIIATGSSAKWLGLPSETSLRGRGISSCATCLPSGSLVVSNPSSVPIEQLTPGHRVLTHLGTFEPVVKLYKRRYKGSLVKVKTRYFRHDTLRLTPNHPVLATRVIKGRGVRYWDFKWDPPRWIPASRLTKQHVLMFPIPRRTCDRSYLSVSDTLGLKVDKNGKAHLEHESYTARRIPDRIPFSPGFLRLSGYFLADGCITSRGINIDFSLKERSYIEDAKRTIEETFGIQPTVKRIGKVARILVFSNIVRDQMSKLFGRYSYGKSLPDWFMFLPTEKQAELVKGFWRGDGATKKLSFEMITNSLKLVRQFQIILLRLGIIPSITVQTKEKLNARPAKIGRRLIRFKHDRYAIAMGGASLSRASEILGVPHDRIAKRKRSHDHAWIRDRFALLPIRDLAKERYTGYVFNLAVRNAQSYVSPIGSLHNCDGYFFRGKRVVVVGGGDTAIEEALFLTKYATEVIVVHRRAELRASKIMQHRALSNEKVKFVWDSVVEEILGEQKVEGVKLRNVRTGDLSIIACDGVFVAIGHHPNTKIFERQIALDEKGYIVSRNNTKTSVDGVFVAGDVHDYKYRQAVTAAGEGCRAAMDALAYLDEQKEVTVAAREN